MIIEVYIDSDIGYHRVTNCIFIYNKIYIYIYINKWVDYYI